MVKVKMLLKNDNKLIIEPEKLKKTTIDIISGLNDMDTTRAYFLIADRFGKTILQTESSDVMGLAENETGNEKVLDNYKNYLISSGKAEKTVSIYISEAGKLLKHLQVKNITLSNIETNDIFTYLSHTKKKRALSINSHSRLVVTLKSFFSFLSSNSIIRSDITLNLKTPKKVDKKREVLTGDQIKKVGDYLKNRTEKFRYENLRDKIIFYLGIKCGLRKLEIMKLNWENIDLDECIIKIINSKGGKDRVVYFNGDLRKLLVNYRRVKGKYIGAVIRGKNGKRICSNTLQEAIRRVYKESRIYIRSYYT